MVNFEAFMARRKKFAINCKTFEVSDSILFGSDYSGAAIARYFPVKPQGCKNLPRTLVSGVLEDANFWTDGAALFRTDSRSMYDAIIKTDKSLEFLFAGGCDVQSLYLVNHQDFDGLPVVIAKSDRGWMVFDIRYIDRAFRGIGPRKNFEFYFNEGLSGLVVAFGGVVQAYVSKVVLGVATIARVSSLLERAVCES